MLHGLRSHIFQVDDLDAAKAWYTELLGHGPTFDQPFYVGFDVCGFELGMQPGAPRDRSPGHGGDDTYWSVDDVAAALARLEELGATVVEPMADVGGGITMGAVIDPFGNAIGVISNPAFSARGSTPAHGPVSVVPEGSRLGAAVDDLAAECLVKEVRLAAPPSAIWPLWTSSRGMAQWLLPTSSIELRIGGPYELYFMPDAPEGTRGGEGNRVLSFLPERMLSFTWNAPPTIPHTRDQRTWVVVELEALSPDETLVRLSHLGWPESGLADKDGPWAETHAYFDHAWGRVMAALAAHFEEAP